MKRFLSIILSVVIISTLTFSVSANSTPTETGKDIAFTVSSAFGKNGESAKVFVDIESDSMMSASVFKLNYDHSVLTAKSIEIGTILKNGYTSKNISSSGDVAVSYANTTPIYDGGRLFEVEFEIIGSVPLGSQFYEIPITLSVEQLIGYDYVTISPSVHNGYINIVDVPYGDVNEMNGVTPSDTLLILNHAVGLAELSDAQKLYADVNGDGQINSVDALFILQYTAGVISNYPIFELKAPTELKIVDKTETEITLTWKSSDYAVGYNVYKDGILQNDCVIQGNTYQLVGLQQDTRYNIEVKAVNVLKESNEASVINVSTNKADRNVTFKDFDGRIINSQIVLSGNDAIVPPSPTRAGYTFVGWDKSTNNILNDTEITALYRINSYTVTFESNGGNAISSQILNYGSNINKPATPQRANYTFMGWYSDSAYVKEWNFATDVISNDITLYAKWQTWSEWITELPQSVTSDDYIIESKTQYRYSDKSETTSTASTLSGWTANGSYVTYGNWTDAGWTKTQPSASNTLQITSTKTVTDSNAYTRYNLYYYRYWNTTYNKYYYTYAAKGTAYYRTVGEWEISYNNTYDGRAAYTLNNTGARNFAGEIWFVSSTESIPAVTHTEWYYQTRTATTNYNYYKWSPYSEWTDNAPAENSNRNIQTRTVYKYIPIQK